MTTSPVAIPTRTCSGSPLTGAALTAAATADSLRLQADAEADAMRVRGEASAHAERARGSAAAASYAAGIGALGENSYTAVQLASILSASNMKLVPDVVLGEGRGNLADVLLARMATGRVDLAPQLTATQTNGHSKPAIAATSEDVIEVR